MVRRPNLLGGVVWLVVSSAGCNEELARPDDGGALVDLALSDAVDGTATADGDAVGADGAGTDGGGADGAAADGAAADGATAGAALCPVPLPASWIFCDDFEGPGDVAARYFEFDDDEGDFRRVSTEAASGSHALEVVFQSGEVGAGGMKVRFGRNPIGSDHRSDEDFEEIYWRMRLKNQPGWEGSPACPRHDATRSLIG